MFDVYKYHWFSPSAVLWAWGQIVTVFGHDIVVSKNDFKKVEEMRKAAIMVLALHKNLDTHFFLQASRDEFPDVYTLDYLETPEKPVQAFYQTVEVVNFEEHSHTNDIGQFILDTKLTNPKKSYDEKTVILCFINKPFKVTFQEIHNRLETALFKPSRVYILGESKLHENVYILTQVWPEIAHSVVDLSVRAKMYRKPDHVKFQKSASRVMNFQKRKDIPAPTAFEAFGLNEQVLRKKYGK